MKTIVAIGALALVLAPAAMASTLVDSGTITGAVPAPAGQLAGSFGEYYVADDGSSWMESNGIAGLQTQAWTDDHGVHHDADQQIFPAATSLVPAIALPGAPGVPLPGLDLPSIPL